MRSVNDELSELEGLVSTRQSKKACRRWCCCVLTTVIILAVCLGVIIAVVAGIGAILSRLPNDPHERAVALLERFPLIDG